MAVKELSKRKQRKRRNGLSPLAGLHEDAMAEVITALRRSTDVDFNHYKRSTLTPRIERRMHATRTETLSDYAWLCKRSRSEVAALYRDLLIGVTRFFRDADAFRALTGQVIPALVERCADGEPWRAWVCGCATGEEAYSIAMLLAEEVERHHRRIEIKIFATDIDPQAIEHAGTGIYDQSALAEMPPELVAKYFVRNGDRYQVTPHLRQMVVFAHHNVLKDPPFTELELITCRNLLIYLEPVLQETVLSCFHHALRDHGNLFLGASEQLGDLASEFIPIDAGQKIFRVARRGPRPSRISPTADDLAIDQGLALLDHFSPPALLVNDRLEMLHVYGGASRFLQAPSGLATLDVLRLLPQGLSALVASGLRRILRDGREFKSPTVRLSMPGGTEAMRVRIRPFSDRQGHLFMMIILEPREWAAADGEIIVAQPDEGVAAGRMERWSRDDRQHAWRMRVAAGTGEAAGSHSETTPAARGE